MTTAFIAPSLLPAFPEIVVAVMALILLLVGVSRREEGEYKTISGFAVFTLFATAVILCRFFGEKVTGFDGLFVVDSFSVVMKLMVVAGAMAALVMSAGYLQREKMARFEYPVLVLFATLGMMVMLSAHDLMTLYLGLELQALPLYVLAAQRVDRVQSAESGMKYFILGALSSGMLLYGASLVYGFSGTTDFAKIADVIASGDRVPAGLLTGLILLLSGLAFKIAAVPFHMWTPDVYEGAPTPVTAFFAMAPKVAAMGLMIRVLMGPFGGMAAEWTQVVVLLSVLSMTLAAVAAIAQTNIKRLLAYSSIGHVGYALIGLAAANGEGVKSVIIYLAIYLVMSAGAFAVVLLMKRGDDMVEDIAALSGLAHKQPMHAFAFAVLMFSMAGIPPLAGFFGKLFVFQVAVEAGLYKLAVYGVITSVVAAFYYLRIVKVMYFDAADENTLDKAGDSGLNGVLALSTGAVLLFIVVPGGLLSVAGTAALSLLR